MWHNSGRVPFDVFMRDAPIMAHSIDAKGYLLNVSNFWATRLKYDPADMVGSMSVSFLTPESRMKAVTKTLPDFYRSGTMRNVHYDFMASDGEIVPVVMSAVAIMERGKFKRSLAVMFDNEIATQMFRAQKSLPNILSDIQSVREHVKGEHAEALDRAVLALKEFASNE